MTESWSIRNLGELDWETVPGFGTWRRFEPIPGIHVHVLQPGEAPGYYHAEEAHEGFLVLSGECLAIVDGEERRMGRWDYLHSPPGTAHITVGAGDEPCAILMFGSPDPSRKVEWIADATAARHGASVARTTGRAAEAYGDVPEPVRARPSRSRRSMASVQRVTGIGGVFQRAGGSTDLQDWYAEHLGIEMAEWGPKPFEWTAGGSTTWAVFDHDTEYFGRQDQAFMVNFRVADLDAMLAQLREAGVEVIEPVQESEFGRFAWAVDPEGTRFELWEPPPGG